MCGSMYLIGPSRSAPVPRTRPFTPCIAATSIGVGRRIAEQVEDAPCRGPGSPLSEDRDRARGAPRRGSPRRRRRPPRAIETVEERRDVDELRPVLHEVEVDHLAARTSDTGIRLGHDAIQGQEQAARPARRPSAGCAAAHRPAGDPSPRSCGRPRSRGRPPAARCPRSSVIVSRPPRCSRNSSSPSRTLAVFDSAASSYSAQAQAVEAVERMRSAVGLRKQPIRHGVEHVERHPDRDRLAVAARRTRSSARACAPTSDRSRAVGRSASSKGSPPRRCGRRCSSAERRMNRHRRRRRRAAASRGAAASICVEERRVLEERDLDGLANPARQSRSLSVVEKPRIVDDRPRHGERAEEVLLSERVDRRS